jgi:hypothetical protein
MTRISHRIRPFKAAFAALFVILAGCSPAPFDTADLPPEDAWRAELAECCARVGGGIPEELVLFADQTSADLPRLVRNVKLRKSWLETQDDALEVLLSRLQPMDVIVNRNGSRLSGGNSFAYFGHAALYLGTEAQLRALGIWDAPELRPHHDAIRSGKIAIEATEIGVHLSDARAVFEADTTVILRPRDCDCACSGARRAFDLLGRGFDFHMRVADGDPDLLCTEVVSLALPAANLPVRTLYGHDVILPDEIVAHALAGRLPLDYVIGIEGYPQGWRLRSEEEIAARILGTYRE